MTTTTATTATSPLHRLLVVLLLTLSILTMSNITAAPQAEAATTGAHVTYCFRHPNGVAASHLDVQLKVWNGSTWVTTRNGRSNARGCGSFRDVSRNRHFTVQLHQVIGNPSYCGYSGYTASTFSSPITHYVTVTRTSTGNHYVGRGTVQQYRWC